MAVCMANTFGWVGMFTYGSTWLFNWDGESCGVVIYFGSHSQQISWVGLARDLLIGLGNPLFRCCVVN